MTRVLKGIIRRPSKKQDVALGEMSVSPTAQRGLRQYRVDRLLANFDPEKLGLIILSHRDKRYYIVDGQHRVAAIREWLGEGWEKQKIECEVYDGLDEPEEADLWLYFNDTLASSALDKFNVGLIAGRRPEVQIAAIVQRAGLSVAGTGHGGLRCIGTLYKIHERHGHEVLLRTLTTARDGWGDSGFRAAPLDGLSLVIQRYDGQLVNGRVVSALKSVRAGLAGLINSAEVYREKTNKTKALCIAAAIVDAINKTKGKKLPGWWKE